MKFPSRRENLIVFVVALSVAFAIFGNGIGGDFVFDDTAVIEKRADLKNSENFFTLFISPYHKHLPRSGLYRPVTMVSYMLNYAVLGEGAAGFRVVNIILHALNAFLVFILLKRLTNSRTIHYVVFFLFLTHPIHVEAVTSLVGRAELLAFGWGIMAVLLLLQRRPILSMGAFLLALMSKETALMVLPLLAYVSWVLNKEKLTVVVKKMWGFAIPLSGYFLLRYVALGKYVISEATTTLVENQLKFAPWFEKTFTAGKILFMYIVK